MKTRITLATAAFAVVATLSSTVVSAQTATPNINQRQANEAARINQGVASGELTKRETAKLRTEQRAIRAEKRAFKADGKVTPAERAKLRADQRAASRHIYNKKHNATKAS